MQKSIRLYQQEFDSSSGLTPQFDAFRKCFKKEITALLKSLGVTDIKINYGHFEVNGFFTINNQAWWFNTGDVRFKVMRNMLIRKADNYNDFRGGINQFVDYDGNFEDNLARILNWRMI